MDAGQFGAINNRDALLGKLNAPKANRTEKTGNPKANQFGAEKSKPEDTDTAVFSSVLDKKSNLNSTSDDVQEKNVIGKKPTGLPEVESEEAVLVYVPTNADGKPQVLNPQEQVTSEPMSEVLAAPLELNKKAITKFFKSMQIEMGVKPEQMVDAMAQLNTEELQLEPEHTVDLVIDNLNIKPAQKERAKELYQNMLNETAVAFDKQNEGLNLEVLSPEQMRERELRQSIDIMAKSFFPVAADRRSKLLTKEELGLQDQQNQPDQQTVVPTNENPEFLFPSTAEGAAVNPAPAKEVVRNRTLDAYSKTIHAERSGFNDKFVSAASLESPAPEMELGVTDDIVTENFEAPIQTLTAPKAHGATAMMMSNGDSNNTKSDLSQSNSENSDKESKFADKDFSSVVGQQQGPLVKGNNPATFMTSATPIANPDQATNNIQDVIKNARVLVQKGGGEMKVKMSPEGLGQVDLKVSVNDGRVDVQMVTENRETKKLLEGSLGELKANLAGHNLKLDSVQVDVGNKSNTEFNQQNSQGREMARDFLGQFHQFNQARRDGFMNTMNERGNGEMQAKKLKGPAQLPGRNSSARSQSRRLDLVA